MKELLTCEGLTKSYQKGTNALDGVLEPAFAVDIGDDDGRFHRFCAPAHFLLAYKRQYNIF